MDRQLRPIYGSHPPSFHPVTAHLALQEYIGYRGFGHQLEQIGDLGMQQGSQKAAQKPSGQGPHIPSPSPHIRSNFDASQALKALALVRSQKVEESLILCDEVLALKPTDDPTLTAMMHVLRGLGRRE